MKKLISAILMTAILSIAVPTFAQTRYYNETRRSRQTSSRYDGEQPYYGSGYNTPNIYDRHRKAVNIAAGAGAGALIGALFGGKKGALIGAGIGAVGGVIVTKKQAPRNYYRRY